MYNLICSHALLEIITEAGGRPVCTRVGHSFIKAEMTATGAVFGCEHSAHYYFSDFFRADTGMLVALHVPAGLGGQTRPLSELVSEFDRYADSGEINSVVADVPAVLGETRAWAAEQGTRTDETDGVTVEMGCGSWFNVRPSNTEPLLRLNVEARTDEQMRALRDEILAMVRR